MKKIAFICVHNSCRSQIAEAFGKLYLKDQYEVYSAGTTIKSQINQDAVRIMKEKYQIDMEQTQYNKTIDEIPTPDILVSMGCGVQCPLMEKAFDDDWNLIDPSGKEDEVFIEVIEQIKEKVLQLKKNHLRDIALGTVI